LLVAVQAIEELPANARQRNDERPKLPSRALHRACCVEDSGI
jgi:hypothetical protein